MRKNLVVARVGRTSLHRCWLDQGEQREWDLYLCPFQEIPPAGPDCIEGDVIAGPKWAGLRQLLNEWQGWREYEYVWFPDDDIFASQQTIGAMFEAARALQFEVFAPGLHQASHYAHFIAMQNRKFFARRVGFVEIMVPGFSRSALEKLLPTLDLSTTGWGWGLDSLWPKLLDYKGLGIIDGVPVLHTRPVGKFRDLELAVRVNAESDRILQQYQCRQEMVSFVGIGADLKEIALSPDELLARLVEGWDYLIAREPKVLRWIVSQQERFFSWPPYSTAGHPTSPA